MDVVEYLCICFVFTVTKVSSVPPAACFANFRWDDCGKAPVAVMYYWKPGSRCEVGLWRGCLPNINMFRDEYECVTTCIFTARAMPEDYHDVFIGSDESKLVTIPANDATDANTETESTNSTTADGQEKVDASGVTTDSSAVSGSGVANGTAPEGTPGAVSPTTISASASPGS